MQAPFERFTIGWDGVKQILDFLGCPKSVNPLNLPLWDWAKLSSILPNVWIKIKTLMNQHCDQIESTPMLNTKCATAPT